MLHLYFGNKKGALLSGENYFNAQVDTSVIESNFGKYVIGKIEKGKVYSKNNIVIPIIGSISPENLSGGTKTLLSLYYNNTLLVDLASMGDNCFEPLAKLVNKFSNIDFFVCTDSYRELYENGYFGSIFIENSNVLVDNKKDLYKEWCIYFERFL